MAPAGYRSYAAGKWHVTPGNSGSALTNRSNWPLQRGFDRFYGTIHGAGSYFDPSSLVRDNDLVTVASDSEYRPSEYYYTDAIAEHAVRFIRDHARQHSEQPSFLYTAFTAAHWPLHAKEADIAKYRGSYDGGYEPIRLARHTKMMALGLLDERWGLVTPAEQWEQVSNTPFREYKHWTHEGGISTPLIAHWPRVVRGSNQGRLRSDPGQLIDIMATCLDVAGASYPKSYAGHSLKSLEGVSLRPAFTGRSLHRARPLIWEHEGNRAIRDGRWKLVSRENQPWKLYDLGADRTEQLDLVGGHPRRVAALAVQWHAWAKRANVRPLSAWRGSAAKPRPAP